MQYMMFYGFLEPCYTITSTRARHPATDKIINRLSLQFMDINPEKSNQGHSSTGRLKKVMVRSNLLQTLTIYGSEICCKILA